MPNVSVAIPAFNMARFLRASVDSALAQQHADFEVIVCDNASTDSTAEVCAAYRDPRLRYVRFEEHVGQTANWNRCLELASGDFVILLHADDLLAPSFLARAVDTLERLPDAVFLHCAVTHVDADGRPLWLQRHAETDCVETGPAFFERLLMEGCLVNPAGVLVRASAYARAGRFSEEIVWSADWDMWLRLSLCGAVAYIAEPLAQYREHGGSGTTSVVASARNGRDEGAVIASVFSRIPDSQPSLQALQGRAVARAAHRTWCWAEEALRRGHRRAAREGLWQAARMDKGLLRDGKLWGLWLASFLDYRWFHRIRVLKRRFS